MVDRTVLDRLAADVGADTMREMCRLFLDDLPGRIAVMKAACGDRDATTVARGAHTLASAARLVGATFLADMCVELERHARAGRLDDAGAAAMAMVIGAAAKSTGELERVANPPPEA